MIIRRLSMLLASLLLFYPSAPGQRKTHTKKDDVISERLSSHQQDALDLLRTLARELRNESDKPGAATLQARIADLLWKFDEPFAREVFGWAFDAARSPPPEDILKIEHAAYAARQAAGVKEVMTRFGARDRKRAEDWFTRLEEERTAAIRSSEMVQFQSELLIQIALQLTSINPAQAQRLGLLSLSSGRIPEEFGRLLFALAKVSRSQSDDLFRAALAALRRSDFGYDVALISLVNYIFTSDGTLDSSARIADAQLLANYFADAAWRQARGASTLPESSASFYSFVEVRGLPIVARYAPDRVPELQGQMRELASRLSPAQLESTAQMRATQQQQIAVANRSSYDLDEQIDRAAREKDAQVRDSLLNRVAHSLMRMDSEKALKVAAMIEDAEIRASAEDDINLVKIQQLLASKSYEEGRKTALKFKQATLQARVLVEIAGKVFKENNDTARAGELLAEAAEIVLRIDPSADKLSALLAIAQQFAGFDSIRGFETLNSVIKVVNQLNAADSTPKSVLSKPRLLTIKTYTVINGREMSSSDRESFDSIDFSQIAPLVRHDYTQTRLLGNKIEQSLRRAKFLTAVAGALLLKAEGRGESLEVSEADPPR